MDEALGVREGGWMAGPREGQGLRAIVLADGSIPSRAALETAWPGWSLAVGLVVAADGGARGAALLGLPIDRWVGDGDSLGPDGVAALEAAGILVERSRPDKDESDTELAVVTAAGLGATEIVILGALGGPRFDHALANVALLSHPVLVGRAAWLLDPAARVSLIAAPAADGSPVRRDLVGRAGDLVSLLPFGGDVEGVATEGLRYPLHDEALASGPARGLSNVREVAGARVVVRVGRLLVVETPATLDG